MVATKDQERKALEKIKGIVQEIGGEDSYIGMAFKGCFDIAEQNIFNDFGDSWMDRWSAAIEEINQTRKALSDTAEKNKELTEELETMTASREHWQKVSEDWKASADKNYEKMIAERSRAEAAEDIANKQ